MSLLAGLCVVQVGQGLAAAVCGRLLADVGAAVACIDPDRSSLLARYLNLGKPEVAHDALAGAELIVCEGRPAELRARACDAAALRRVNATAGLVLISPYGQTGPKADDPASDLTLMFSSGIARLLSGRWTIRRKRRSARWASNRHSSAGLPLPVPACTRRSHTWRTPWWTCRSKRRWRRWRSAN
jgi:crotonobetainyl-CoA:carnitine CoA-transferase CaiB-like acyl-CoA transferase